MAVTKQVLGKRPLYPPGALTSSVVGFFGSVVSSSSSSSSSSSRSAGMRTLGPRLRPSSPTDFWGSRLVFSSPTSSPLLRPGQLSELGDPVRGPRVRCQDHRLVLRPEGCAQYGWGVAS